MDYYSVLSYCIRMMATPRASSSQASQAVHYLDRSQGPGTYGWTTTLHVACASTGGAHNHNTSRPGPSPPLPSNNPSPSTATERCRRARARIPSVGRCRHTRLRRPARAPARRLAGRLFIAASPTTLSRTSAPDNLAS